MRYKVCASIDLDIRKNDSLIGGFDRTVLVNKHDTLAILGNPNIGYAMAEAVDIMNGANLEIRKYTDVIAN